MINRSIEKLMKSRLFSGKALVLIGARQTGKTTILKKMFKNKEDVLWLDGDDPDTSTLFNNITSTRLKNIIGSNKLIIIDEAQRINDIGIKLKLITDQIKEVQLIATGSSAFELANKINEPLTGRKWEYKLYPLSFNEMVEHHGLLDEIRLLNERLIYGYYPEIVTHPGDEKDRLKQLTTSYLYKDILKWNKIKKPDKLNILLQVLAFQIGNEVSNFELGKITGLNNETVESYIQILEQSYIIFRLNSFSRNLRKELKRSKKIYFYDNGIRNAVIAAFNPVEVRNDVGNLWENFLISERIKHLHYNNKWVNSYFWRTHDQQEIDYIEESDGILSAYEFKWNPKSKRKVPAIFLKTYSDSKSEIITPENFDEFLLEAKL